MKDDVLYSFTTRQLAVVIRASIFIANDYYNKGHTDDEVFKLTVAAQLRGLTVERILVDRGLIEKPEFQTYTSPKVKVDEQVRSEHEDNN